MVVQETQTHTQKEIQNQKKTTQSNLSILSVRIWSGSKTACICNSSEGNFTQNKLLRSEF